MKATYAILAACLAVGYAAPNPAPAAPCGTGDIIVSPKVISAETDVFVHPRVGQAETDVFVHPRLGQVETDVFVHPRLGQVETDVSVHRRVGQGETDIFERPEPTPRPGETPCGPALPARTAGIDDIFVHPKVKQGVIDVRPNPSMGILHVDFIVGPTPAEPVARLYDPQGRVVATLKTGTNDLIRVARGTYFVRAEGIKATAKVTVR